MNNDRIEQEQMPKYQQHIVSDHRILLGKPIIKGTRISVEFILKKLSEGATIQQVVQQHGLKLEDVHAALDYASARLADREESVAKK